MTARMQRTQILLEPEQHRILSDMARTEGRSLSDIVREFIQVQLNQRAQEQSIQRQRQLANLEQIGIHRQMIAARRSTLPDLPDPATVIDRLREERDAELTSSHTRD